MQEFKHIRGLLWKHIFDNTSALQVEPADLRSLDSDDYALLSEQLALDDPLNMARIREVESELKQRVAKRLRETVRKREMQQTRNIAAVRGNLHVMPEFRCLDETEALSVRTLSALEKQGIRYFYQLAKMSKEEIRRIRGIGVRAATEIEQALKVRGLRN